MGVGEEVKLRKSSDENKESGASGVGQKLLEPIVVLERTWALWKE